MKAQQEIQASGDSSKEVLAFRLGVEEYGIDILTVQELRSYEVATEVANAPTYLKGLFNLRGIIVPIIDMRIKFGLGEPVYDDSTVVMILNIGRQVVGLVVDAVSDVLRLSPEQIKPAPTAGTIINPQYLMGLGTLENRLIVLLNIAGLMSFVCDLDITPAQ
ncbi:chemotaxis protein CheW [Oxalobacter vibrioformis]|uniref:Chemotaxis protein CheW n=1 Tax=Oxalobacter vibrioformis TaxID=933080 RepID=A0A9E9P250_9BURK|nr:chemotaxis protein CheW [Oxalobacter vibrioformis]NLC24054.1 chemotaxis protein CheW [Oxalobacter sp.]WAW09509.1 chemotaxis protein CheW [Oxalobacter vibrioformis]